MYPNKIILHHSLTKDGEVVNWNAIRKYHVNTLHWKDVGYHFGIELIGSRYEILTGRLMTEKGAHTKGYNGDSLGVCLIGNFDEKEPPEEQWRLAVDFVRSLCTICYISPQSVFGHRDFANYKSCPGSSFSIEKFRSQL